MKHFSPTHPQLMLFALLKSSLCEQMPELSLFQGATPAQWKECAQLAARQGVLLLAWEGVERLPQDMQPYADLTISWAMAAQKYEEKYAFYCNTVAKLSALLKENGLGMVQLKGVGLSTRYPVPSHREGGDIDIYTYPLGDKSENKSADQSEDKSEAYRLANSLFEQMGIEVDTSHSKHSHFIYNGIPIENHIKFLDTERCRFSLRAELILHRCLNPQRVELCGGQSIMIPSDKFNLIFTALHALQHYGCGLSLHHIYDWACLVKKFGIEAMAECNDKHFMRGVAAMSHICNLYLGTEIKVCAKQRLVEDMLGEIFYPLDYYALPEKGFFRKLGYRYRRFTHKIISRNRYFHTPIWRNGEFWNILHQSIAINIKKFLFD